MTDRANSSTDPGAMVPGADPNCQRCHGNGLIIADRMATYGYYRPETCSCVPPPAVTVTTSPPADAAVLPQGVFKARKKPVTIETIQWTGTNLREVIAFTGRHPSAADWSWDHFDAVVEAEGLKIFTLEGSHMATIGDYIIKGVHGEFYPCKPDIFLKTYDTDLSPEPCGEQVTGAADMLALFIEQLMNGPPNGRHMSLRDYLTQWRLVQGALDEYNEVRKGGAPKFVAATECRSCDQLMTERDNAEEQADKLAECIEGLLGIEIGEHTSGNEPWQNAIDAAEYELDKRKRAAPEPRDWHAFSERVCPESWRGDPPHYVLLWNGHHVGVGYRLAESSDGEPEFCDEAGEYITPAPTHWREVPTPPTKDGGA